MIFWKSSKGGGFSIQKCLLQILDLYKGLFSDLFRKNLLHDFPRAIRNFSENSSYWVAWPFPWRLLYSYSNQFNLKQHLCCFVLSENSRYLLVFNVQNFRPESHVIFLTNFMSDRQIML